MLLAGQDEDTADENARAALDLVGMSGAATKLPDELSGGQSQRVAIARVTRDAACPDTRRRADRATRPCQCRPGHHRPPEHRNVDRSGPRALHPRPRRRRASRRPMVDARRPAVVGRRLAGFMIATWTLGLLRRRSGRMAATAIGIAAAVALLSCLGIFMSAAQASMTARAARAIAVDWQVEVQPIVPLSSVTDAVRSTPHVQAALPVGFAHSSGLSASGGGSTRTTGPAMVLGIPPEYRDRWPREMRTLVGSDRGVLVAQQTAANLGVAPGDTVQIGRPGMPPVNVRIDGVVELPQADSLFQKVGAPPAAQPVAPPDNVAGASRRPMARHLRPACRRPPRSGQHADPHRARS